MIDQALIENPPFIRARYFHSGRLKPVQLIVIHTMEAPEKGTTAEATARYFQNPKVPASAHYCIDNDSIVQCVWDSYTAFGCKNANANGVHLEHAGYADTNDWRDEYNTIMLYNSAQMAAYLVKKFDIPVQKAVFAADDDPAVIQKGFCGHVEVPLHGSHYDPGDNFPWDSYLDLVNNILTQNEGG